MVGGFAAALAISTQSDSLTHAAVISARHASRRQPIRPKLFRPLVSVNCDQLIGSPLGYLQSGVAVSEN
jgi:hypothetical protein